MKRERTRGPWSVGEIGNWIEANGGEITIGQIRGFNGRVDGPEPDDHANALLVAAAPELLEALHPFAELDQDLTDAACHRGLTTVEKCVRCSRVLAARAAVEKAEGET